MKRPLKIFLLSLLGLFLLCSIAIGIALWLVFTPARLTPMVQKQLDKQINCQSEIGSVELTLFSTFPSFGLKIDQIKLINPVEGAPCDTLFRADKIIASIDINAFRKQNTLIISDLELENVSICAFIDSTGKTNFDIVPASNDSSESSMESIILDNISLKNSQITYLDLASKMEAKLQKLSGKISASLKGDSLYTRLATNSFALSFAQADETYLQQAQLKLNTQFAFKLDEFKLQIDKFSGSLNSLPIEITGTAVYNKETETSNMDLSYKLSSTAVSEILKLVPQSQQSKLEGVDITGFLASEGKIKGIYKDSIFPWIDARLSLENGVLKHASLPLPLEILKSDFQVYTNLQDDKLSYFRIHNFEGKTTNSTVQSSGLINHLFTDITADLTSKISLSLAEFNPMIPKELKANAKGRAKGTVKSKLSMSQVEKLDFEKMKLSGNLVLSSFNVQYDSLSLAGNHSKLRFEMPYTKAKSKKTRFAFFELEADQLNTSKQLDFSAKMKKAKFTAELSNILDSTRTPNILCDFKIGNFIAEKDEMTLSLSKPFGKIDLSPQTTDPTLPNIKLEYTSNEIEGKMEGNSFNTESIKANLAISYAPQKEDVLQQWMPKGSFKMGKGTAILDSFFFPIEISGLDLKNDSEQLIVEKSLLQIDKSDFELSGTINNLNSYLKGDSILRAEFNLASEESNLAQLMTLTGGLGDDDYSVNEEDLKNNSFSGPYMIPKKIDVLLHTTVNKVIYGATIATDIKGDLRVNDGLMVLDDFKFSTPAADMQLTAMYRTPRKNHLFVGMDLHLLDVEIKELLRLIPNLDSIMPMLRSFEGDGEFHLAVETYTDSLYNPKISTLRGISSIQGNNLVLMDGETFSEIAKKLYFNKKTRNNIDSLSAEFTIFRDEVDVYPFLIVMDKYKAIVSGRHSLDLSFDYHISVIKSPLPFRMGLNIGGTMDNMKFKLVRPQYTDTSRPAERKDLEVRQLQLKEVIRRELRKKRE